jgi:tRNA A-37 threonylcarbamoyl transferase component Bud32
MRRQRGLPDRYRKVRISDFEGLAREPWPSSVPLGDVVGKIGQPDGVIVKMRAERAIKIRGDLHLKEEFPGGWRSWPLQVKGLWGRSRLRRQWQASLRARERGIRTPEPLAYLERKRSLLFRQSLLVTRWESSFFTLTQYLRGREEGWIGQRGPAFLEHLAAAVRQMHGQGMMHSDLKGSNILVKEEEGTWSFLFTDLKAARFSAPGDMPPGRGERDVIRLLASLRAFFDSAQRALFLRSYLLAEEREARGIVLRWEAESQRRFPSRQGMSDGQR